MQIDLSNAEVEMIEKALDVWEKESHSSAMFEGMFGLMLSPKEDRDSEKAKLDRQMKAATEEANNRRRRGTLLRAKLIQAQAKASEHEFAEREVG